MSGLDLVASIATAPVVLVLLAGLLGLGAALLWYHQRLWRARRGARQARERAALAEAALTAAPCGQFTFSARGGETCSASLARSLGLKDGEAADFSGLLQALEPEGAGRLSDAAERLRATGQGFSLAVQRRDGTRRFQVDGARAVATGLEQHSDLIWFRDVTALHDELTRALAERDDFARLIDSLPIPVWVRGADDRLRFCNETYARAVGIQRDGVIANGVELAGAALAESSRALARRARQGGQVAADSHHVVVAGERRLLELAERPLGSDRTLGTARDLTGEEEIRTELQRHIAAHAEVLETLSSGIAIFGPDLKLKFYNNAYVRMWGLDEAFLNSEPEIGDILEALRERRRLPEQQDFPAYKRQRIKRISTVIEPFEELVYIPDGTTVRMLVSPHPFGGVLMLWEDVTDRLALERSYNTLMAVQRETLDNLYEGVAVYGADGRLKLFNPAFARIWNLDPEFLASEPHVRDVAPRGREFFPVSDEDWPAFLEKICVTATEPHAISGRRERADGSVLDVAQVPLPDGASLFTYLDVTDSIRVERALRERNEALETTDRLKSEFIANVSYELRTPLNAIVGFAEILENQFFGELNERQLEYSRAIVESSQRLLILINDILDLATIEAGYLKLDLQPVDIAPMLESLRTLGHERARNRGIVFTLDCAPNVGSLVADERRVKQALFNLISNAFKFTPEGGRVTVGARRSAGEVQLSVTDTGIGIPQEEHARVFGKFERGSAQGRQSGAGLGLSLVKSLVELHGGWVELDSVPEQGTRVICHLPLQARLRPAEEIDGETLPTPVSVSESRGAAG
ncbi:MAG: ATP-binding protein [Kiloniellales bacterium]